MELLRTRLRGKGIPSAIFDGHLITGVAGTLNVSNTTLAKARAYAESVFKEHGKSLDAIIPTFDQNYMLLQKASKNTLNIHRSDMPVISQQDVKSFENDLKRGNLDLFKPFTFGHLYFPKNLLGKRQESADWLELGQKDGDPYDDVVNAKIGRTPARNLKPIQGQIWLEKMVPYILKSAMPVDQMTMVISSDHHIIDGHHRYGQAMLTDPNIKLKTLFVPLSIEMLLKVGHTYGNAKGEHQRK